MANLVGVFNRLWEQVSQECYVSYHGRLESNEIEDAWYSKDPWGNGSGPQIWIFWERAPDRKCAPVPQSQPDLVGNVLGDCCLLAHEYGHRLSDKAGNRNAAYLAALEQFDQGRGAPQMTPEEKAIIYGEEERAWALGRAVLVDLGFEDLGAFDTRRDEGLAEYRKRLALE
jgi:hypothetical protein